MKIISRAFVGHQIHIATLDSATTLIMQTFLEEKIMSIITAIFQAVFQVICWILPISETGHSAVFHDFSNRFSGACSSLTGIIHIGIAVGIVIAMYKIFIILGKEFFGSIRDLTKKQSPIKDAKPSRHFMLMTLLSFLPMLVLLIPVGKGKILYSLLSATQFNKTLLDEGILLALMGALALLVSQRLKKSSNNKNVGVIEALIVGVANVFLVCVSGLSLVFGIFAVLMLLGVAKKPSYRYAMVMSVPVLVVMGIVEIVASVTKVGVVPAIIGIVIAVALSYFVTNVLRVIINKNYIKYFGIYDIALGVIVLVVGIFELIYR